MSGELDAVRAIVAPLRAFAEQAIAAPFEAAPRRPAVGLPGYRAGDEVFDPETGQIGVVEHADTVSGARQVAGR